MYEVDVPIIDITPEVEVDVTSDEPIETQTDLVIVDEMKDYEKLINKPQIEDVELVGNKSIEDIGILSLTNAEIEEMLRI